VSFRTARRSPLISVVIVIATSVKKLVKKVTSKRDDPILNNRSWKLGRMASAMTLNDTNIIPNELNDGVSFQSAAANRTNPVEIAKAHVYSFDEKVRRLTIVEMSMVGNSLQDRKTTFVGKLM